MEIATWVVQGLLAFVFLMAGLMKATQPKDKLREKIGDWVDEYKIGTLKMIGLSEVLGAVGLILPTALNTASFFTPVAAICLIVVMILAAALHARRKESVMKNIIFIAMLGFVIYSRWGLLAGFLS